MNTSNIDIYWCIRIPNPNNSFTNPFDQLLNHHSLLHCNSITRFLTGCCWSVDMDCPLCSPPFIFCASLRISSCNSIIYEYRHTMYVRTEYQLIFHDIGILSNKTILRKLFLVFTISQHLLLWYSVHVNGEICVCDQSA